MARPATGHRGDRSTGPAAKKSERGAALSQPLPAAFQWVRNAGLVVVWAVAVVCGWHAGGGAWGEEGSSARVDLLNGAARGAIVWLGLTTIWLVGFGLCRRIIEASAFSEQRSAVSTDRTEPTANS